MKKSMEDKEKLDILFPMLISAHNEMGELSKKKQDGVLNVFKVKMINRLLNDLKKILGNDPSVEYLDILDEEMLPQNSDVVLLLGQYRAVVSQFHKKLK